ncbi:unnamed protein product [Psylliodes chrysocephalus]|uniref:lysozyme n=1 Tax=Psylliodes chrysocephalus TaxID=3402493 RepID=A0A9P0CJ31_9CUCU|nr:unnamed protein product [Psylliodes chrysocephala]
MLFNLTILITVLVIAYSKIYERCDLAKDLLHVHHIPSEQIPTWICIASHGSNFDTRDEKNVTGEYGLFQIPRKIWCGNVTIGCNALCSNFTDDEIEDDVECVKKIYKNSGFGGWNIYYQHCKGNQENLIKDCHF